MAEIQEKKISSRLSVLIHSAVSSCDIIISFVIFGIVIKLQALSSWDCLKLNLH